MRKFVLSGIVAAICCAAGATGAFAYENFIPMGTGYSTEVDSVPSFGSERGQINQAADVIETEIYRSNREAAEFDSRLRQFQSSSQFEGSDNFIDY